MTKWYVKSGAVEKIISIPDSTPIDAAIAVFRDTNQFDVMDDYFYVDERGMKNFDNRDSLTLMIKTVKVMSQSYKREKKGY
jgi:hypothetical protein